MARVKKEAALTPEERLQAALVPDWEWPYKLPENWCWTNWGKCGKFIAGSGFKNEYQGFTNYDIPFYKVSSLKIANETGYLYDNTNTIDEAVRKKLKAVLIPTNSLLFAKIGEAIRLNRRAINTVPCCIDNNMMAFVPQICQLKYAFYWSKGIDLYDFTNATTVPAIRKTDLEKIPFPLAPFAEQQRIVDRIESLFAKLDEAKEKAQAVVDSFETRKAAILHKAFAGELTAKWREEHGVSIDNWKTTRFDSVAAIRSNLVDPAEYQSFPHIAPDNIEKKTGVLLEYHTIAEDGVTSGKHRFYSGQILYSKIRPNLSKVVVVDFDGLCSADMYPIEAYQNARCLWYYMLSDEFLLQASTAGSRSVLPKINQKELSALTVHLPTNDREQEEITRILDELFDKEQQSKEAAEAVLDQIDLMKKSILARAFRGELGTNNPSEESALELLKKILGEDEVSQATTKKPAKKITIPADIKGLLSNVREEEIIKLLLKSAPQPVSIQEIMSLSSKKFELMDALRSLEKKQLITKNESGEYSLTR